MTRTFEQFVLLLIKPMKYLAEDECNACDFILSRHVEVLFVVEKNSAYYKTKNHYGRGRNLKASPVSEVATSTAARSSTCLLYFTFTILYLYTIL